LGCGHQCCPDPNLNETLETKQTSTLKIVNFKNEVEIQAIKQEIYDGVTA